MNWGSWSEFLRMGGYGGYVWGSYGVSAACIVIELWLLRTRARRLRRNILKSR